MPTVHWPRESRGAGSFCPDAGNRNPHRYCSFAELTEETAVKSLRHSCRSELHRQGISLDSSSLRFRRSRTLSSLASVHAGGDDADLRDSVRSQVCSLLHQTEHVSELEKIQVLLRLQRMFLEKRNDVVVQVFHPSHAKRHPLRVVTSHHAAPEERLECVEQLYVSFVLHDGELGKHLDLRSLFWVRIDVAEERAFAVHEPYHPVSVEPL